MKSSCAPGADVEHVGHARVDGVELALQLGAAALGPGDVLAGQADRLDGDDAAVAPPRGAIDAAHAAAEQLRIEVAVERVHHHSRPVPVRGRGRAAGGAGRAGRGGHRLRRRPGRRRQHVALRQRRQRRCRPALHRLAAVAADAVAVELGRGARFDDDAGPPLRPVSVVDDDVALEARFRLRPHDDAVAFVVADQAVAQGHPGARAQVDAGVARAGDLQSVHGDGRRLGQQADGERLAGPGADRRTRSGGRR